MAKKSKNKGKHLQKVERFCIEKLLKRGRSFSEISRTLGRGLSTISEEVNENGGRNNYNAEQADHRAYLKQYWKKKNCNKVAMDNHLSKFVEKKLSCGWSPETISDRLKIQSGLKYASRKSIRKFNDSIAVCVSYGTALFMAMVAFTDTWFAGPGKSFLSEVCALVSAMNQNYM